MKKSQKKTHIFINGFMGAGKSKIGPILAKHLNRSFYDSDNIIEQECGKKIHEIFNDEGETFFRKKEKTVISQLIENSNSSVIALGGGAFLDSDTKKKAEESGIVVYLRSSPEAVFERVKHTSKRPLLQIARDENFEANLFKKITELLNKRRWIYESAHIIIDRDGLEPDQVAEKILEQINERNQN